MCWGCAGGVVPFFRIFTDLSTSHQKGSLLLATATGVLLVTVTGVLLVALEIRPETRPAFQKSRRDWISSQRDWI